MPRAISLKRVAARCLDLLVPRACASCADAIAPMTGDLCETCAWEMSGLVADAYCHTCGEDRGPHLLIEGRCTACRLGEHGPRFNEFIRTGRYGGALQRLILRFKTEVVLDRLLGELLANTLRGRLDPRKIDAWVPIPSHWLRRIRRGFQPTELLARAAVRHWGGRVTPLLRMTKNISTFHRGMSASQRIDAISGAFELKIRSRLTNTRICLIDDVTTTGATLNEARRVLRRAGARWIAAAVLAKVSHLPVLTQGVDPSMIAP